MASTTDLSGVTPTGLTLPTACDCTETTTTWCIKKAGVANVAVYSWADAPFVMSTPNTMYGSALTV